MRRSALRRWHIWLGWIIGPLLLLWTATGLFMVAAPMERVRGEHLIGEPAAFLPGPDTSLPQLARPVLDLALQPQAGRSVWVIRYADGTSARADSGTGLILPPLSAAEARDIVASTYVGSAAVRTVTLIEKDRVPVELRRPIRSWRVELADGTRFFVNADTGEVAARRTRLWRVYDFMWGLHILDPGGREDSNHPTLIVLTAVSLIGVLMAILLLPFRRRKSKLAAD